MTRRAAEMTIPANIYGNGRLCPLSEEFHKPKGSRYFGAAGFVD